MVWGSASIPFVASIIVRLQRSVQATNIAFPLALLTMQQQGCTSRSPNQTLDQSHELHDARPVKCMILKLQCSPVLVYFLFPFY
jgi:hypothetical protein